MSNLVEDGIMKLDSWDELPGSYRKPIRNGIRMAKKLAPTDMLMMPVIKGEV